MPFQPHQLLALVPDTLPGLLGVRIDHLHADRVTGTLPWRPDITGDGTLIHGGALMTFADCLGAFGTALGLVDGVATATIESKTNFFRGAREGDVRGESVPIHVGRHYTVWQTSVFQGDKILAQTTQSQILIQR